MKYQIDTIPVLDAVNEKRECPFCILQKQLEEKYVDFYLSDAMMQPHIRIRTNETGFCSRHFEKMLNSDSKLALGLMAHTHTNYILEKTNSLMDKIVATDNVKKEAKSIDSLIENIKIINDKCVVCEDIDRDIERYIFTYIYMYKKDPAFKDVINESKGFCLHHYVALLEAAKKQLHGKNKTEFINIITSIEKENLERLTGEVKWFCDKFDHRNMDKPWGNSRDSLPRILLKLSGIKMDLKK